MLSFLLQTIQPTNFVSGGFTQVGPQTVLQPTTPNVTPVKPVVATPVIVETKPEVVPEDVPMGNDGVENGNGNGDNVKIVKFHARSGKGRVLRGVCVSRGSNVLFFCFSECQITTCPCKSSTP